MARLQLDFSNAAFFFTTQMTVRVTDVNMGGHVGNDSMISMLSEARARFLFDCGIDEINTDKQGIIVTDLATIYRAEAHARDQLCIEMGVMDLNLYGGDIIFRVTRLADQTLIALAKYGFVFFDYNLGKVQPMPEVTRQSFLQKINQI
jgi:acyl-CoA thioesterase FadM